VDQYSEPKSNKTGIPPMNVTLLTPEREVYGPPEMYGPPTYIPPNEAPSLVPGDATTNVVSLPPNKTDINSHTVWITRFEDETAQAMRKGEWSLPAWRDHILAENAKSKTATPWLKLAVFGDVRSAKGCLRHDANVLEISGVEVDYDDEVISFDVAVEVMRSAGVRCLLYTSASHSPATPRWRILVPLSKNHEKTSRAPMVGRINGLFNGSLAPESFVLSTSYHYGSVNGNPHHRVEVLDGQFINLMDRLHAGSIDKDGHRVGHKDFEQSRSSVGKPGEPGNEFSKLNQFPADKDKIVAALAVIDADCGHKPWYKIGCAIRFELGDDGNSVFHEWSATAKAIYKYAECEKKWKETEGNTYHRAGSIFRLANLASPTWRDAYEASKQAPDAIADRPAQVSPEASRRPAITLSFFSDIGESIAKRWIMKGVIAKGETSSWIAPPGKGKSALLTDIAIHVASGTNWRGFRSKERCGVVYFALERGDLVKRRLTAHARRNNLTDLPIAVASQVIDLASKACVGDIVAAIRSAEQHFGCSVGMIVIDTFAKGIAVSGGDEDKAKDQNLTLANLRMIQEQVDVHIAIVGHTGKDESKGARGSNAHAGDADMMIQLRGDAIKTATVIMANDQPEGLLTRFKLETWRCLSRSCRSAPFWRHRSKGHHAFVFGFFEAFNRR
jgi:AAA domain-containing protein/primase-like protein